MSCSFTIIISCMVFFFLLKLCILCAANSLNILSALFPPPFLLPPHPFHTHWNQGLLGWVLCCTGKKIFFFKVSLLSLSLLVCLCVSVRFKPDAGHLWYLVSSYWQCFILHVEMGGVLVRFHFTLMNRLPHSGVLTIFIVVMRLCVLQTGKGQKEALWELFTVLFVTLMVLLKSFFFFSFIFSVRFPLRVEIEVKLFIKNVWSYSTWNVCIFHFLCGC